MEAKLTEERTFFLALNARDQESLDSLKLYIKD
jgi:hypothetical protein